MKEVLLCCCLLFAAHRVFAAGPVAVNDTATTTSNHSIVIPVTQNDSDVNGGALSVTVIQQPQHGLTSIVNYNQVLYTPQQAYFGTDSFIYKVCDTLGLCAQASVRITILGTNKTPVAANYVYTFNYTVTDTALNVLLNDRDSSGEPLTLTSVINFDSAGMLGVLVLDSNGTVFFNHSPVTCGTDSFQYVLCNYSLCDTGVITVYVSCPGNFFLPQGFSPNGDGINDLLVFPELGYFPNSALKVFNRYGTVVYESADYQNNWDGTDVDTNRPLPDGTYFYLLQVSDGRNFNNYVIINR